MDQAQETPTHTSRLRFSWIGVTLLCVVTAFLFVQDPIDDRPQNRAGIALAASDAGPGAAAGAQASVAQVRAASKPSAPATEPVADRSKFAFQLSFCLSVAAIMLWGTYAFTGATQACRIEGVRFAYFFVIAFSAALALPPLLKSQAIGNEPIGIVSGCVADAKVSEQIRCPTSADKEKGSRNQWLLNIGGTLEPQSAGCAGRDHVQSSGCKIGSPDNRARVSNGLVVPLHFVIIALFGGAISLSRRVPEIQKCSDENYVGTALEPKIGVAEARERLMFQIMQFLSAPLIAVVAYQVIAPTSEATSAGLAFMCGFGSESILLMVRGVVEGVKQKTAPAPAVEKTKAAPLTVVQSDQQAG